jgi:hypothetical protein
LQTTPRQTANQVFLQIRVVFDQQQTHESVLSLGFWTAN